MVSSGVWAGEIPLEKAHNLREVGADRRTMKQELERIGYLGTMEASYQAMPLGVRYNDYFMHATAYTVRLTLNFISVNHFRPEITFVSQGFHATGCQTGTESVQQEI